MTSSTGRPGLFAEEALPTALRDHLAERYELDREIARGGMSTVWVAKHRESGHTVAIKVLRPGFAQALGVQRFLREIQIAANLRGPTLVPLQDSGVVDGLPYYVMPFADGGTLRMRLTRERQLPIAEAVRVARDIVKALQILHDGGIVHRDVKPANVLLTSSGDVLLADYGIARAIEVSATDKLTSTGIAVGTPAYMSPEQASADVLDERSDLYSLGCVLYEMLAGDPPFHGPSQQAIIARHISEPPPTVHVVRPSVPPALEAIVMRCLAKVPADRFPNAGALLEALDTIEVATPTETRRASTRRRVRITGVVVVAVAIASALWYSRARVTLDPERVVVYPFADLRAGHPNEGAELALLVGSALERAEPTKWLDGWPLLDEKERGRPRDLSASRAAAIARAQHAGYFVDGLVSTERDSLRVTLNLHDTKTGDVTARAAAGPLSASAGDLALEAIVKLLPTREGLARVVDLSSLRGRSPAAVVSWLRGERLYRQSRMAEAEVQFEKALLEDSTLAPAAVRAAAAAGWMTRMDTALALVRLALRHEDALAPRQRQFSRALQLWLEGRANEAIATVRPLLAAQHGTADAWMLAGEVQLHLLPTITVDSQAMRAVPVPTSWPLEQFASTAFDNARAIDADFTPPLAHLAEIVARRGDADSVARIVRAMETAHVDSAMLVRFKLVQQCVQNGAARFDASGEAKRHVRAVFDMGMKLFASANVQARRCAIAAFRAVLASDPAIGAEDWTSLRLLQGLYASAGDDRAALALVDSAVAGGLDNALGLFVVDAAAGLDVGDRANAFVAQLESQRASRTTPSLWLLMLRSNQRADTAQLREIEALLAHRASQQHARLDSLMARVAGAYLALARHDTARALPLFAALQPTAPCCALEGSLWESLAAERLVYARLLLARGDAAAAHRVASTFDAPMIQVHSLFLRASLLVRRDAARALADSRLETHAHERLAALRAAAAP